MKTCLKQMDFTRTIAFLTVLIALVVTSCEEEDVQLNEDQTSETVITTVELNYSDEADQISEEISSIAEEVYTADEVLATSKSFYNPDFLPDCASITTEETDTTRQKTIDFGEGCELPNGNVLSGIITMSYVKDMELTQKTITLVLDNFTFNGVLVEGGADVLRVRSNEEGNPQGTATFSFNATWPDGETASFTGTRTREWIEGYGTGFWGDNVYLITGNKTFVNRAGNTFAKQITSPLRRELSCRFIVSGVVEISRNEVAASLDFGDGSCDAMGTITYADGTSEDVRLRRFSR